MSVQFAALMALSRTHTEEQKSLVANQLTERKRKEEEQRKKRLEQERKELELEKKRRLQHFENLKREEQRQKEKQEKEKALEAERERRAQAQLDALRYGPKKAVAKYPTRENPHSVDDNKTRAPEALTREELRERRRLAEQRRMLTPSKRTSYHSGTRRPGKRLPGGAIDTTASLPAAVSNSTQTTRERIAAIPPTLVKLNQVKRDLRTIDEIQTQLKNAKALEGDQARSFDDYFGDRKKDSVTKHAESPTPSTQPKAVSKASTPVPKLPKTPISVAAASRVTSASSSRAGSHDRVVPKAAKASGSRPSRPASAASVPSKKRRGTSLSPPPPKRRGVSLSEEEDSEDDGYGSAGDAGYAIGSIYKMMRGGRADRHDNIFSDDEDDMEVDARVLEKEEKMSSRIAQREEAEATAAERRHEEEKARRKKEKTLALARG